jgi:hypothetical protein
MQITITAAHITSAARSADALVAAAVRDAYAAQVRPVRSVFPRLVRAPFIRDAKRVDSGMFLQVDVREVELPLWLTTGLVRFEQGFGFDPCSFEI